MGVEEYTPQRITNLCKKYNISIYRLSKMTGISQSVLSNLIKGKNLPTLITLEKICDAFGISMAQFFSDEYASNNLLDEQREFLEQWSFLNKKERKAISACIHSLRNEE